MECPCCPQQPPHIIICAVDTKLLWLHKKIWCVCQCTGNIAVILLFFGRDGFFRLWAAHLVGPCGRPAPLKNCVGNVCGRHVANNTPLALPMASTVFSTPSCSCRGAIWEEFGGMTWEREGTQKLYVIIKASHQTPRTNIFQVWLYMDADCPYKNHKHLF